MSNVRIRRTLCSAPLAAGLALMGSASHAVADTVRHDQGDASANRSTTKHRRAHTARKTHPAEAPHAAVAAAVDPLNAPARALNTQAHQDLNGPTPSEERLTVTASGMNILHQPMGMSRLPTDAMHIPQTVNVVPQMLMQQQNVKSLDEALRNVPGITASVGEGEGGASGDQFLIRGFAAQNDIYEDGLRDFGVYTRDSFDYDHVSVIKGPSSEVFGNGTTGGAINVVTKVAQLGNSYAGTFSGGSGSYYRGTLDVNQQLNATTAVRLTGMGNDNNVVGRDNLFSHRWGVAPSIAFGLGKRTTFTLQYFHQSNNQIPDYGVPVITAPGQKVGKPVTEYGVKRTNWYGTTYDQDDSSVDMLTGRLKFDLNSHITLYDDLRGGMYHRYFSASQEACGTTCVSALFSSNPQAATISRNGGLGGPNPYQQNDWSVQNVLSGIARFNTGRFRHEMIGGVDVEHVYDSRRTYAYATTRPGTSLLDPSSAVPGLILGQSGQYPNNLTNIKNGVGRKEYKTSSATDVGLFISDQVWLAEWFSVKAGMRWDHWGSNYDATGGVRSTPNTYLTQSQNTINPSVSLSYTPNDRVMVYFNWAQATTPTGLYVTNSVEPLTTANAGFKPERSNLYEIGAKYNAFHGRMGFTASLFRLEKNNALQTDPTTGNVTASSDQQRNQGLELSASGNITRNWTIIGTYALYDAETTSSLTAADVGRKIQYVPKNSATLWSTYTVAPNTRYNLAIGGGIIWREGVWLDAANTARVPANVDFDVMVAHTIGKHWRVAMNGYNLANRLNYSNLFADRVTPSIGRSFLFNISATY